jgi:hypothetical protein
MSVDAAIFTMSLGFSNPDPFARFVPGFYEAIAAMDPAPAEVCIACPFGDSSGVDDPPADFPVAVRIVRVTSRNVTDFLRAAVLHSGTKWLVWCGIDDRMTPDALADIASGDAVGADVIACKCRTSSGEVIGHWNLDELMRGGLNRMAPNSPFTRAAYDRAGGWPDIHFHDWGLWMRMGHAGVRVMHSDRVGMRYDLGQNHMTRSGVRMPWEDRVSAMTEIDQLVQSLWPPSF